MAVVKKGEKNYFCEPETEGSNKEVPTLKATRDNSAGRQSDIEL
jgi:hypothetical protein